MYFRNNEEFSNQDYNEIRNDAPNMYGPQMMPNSMDYEDDDMYRSFHRPGGRGRRGVHHVIHHHFHHFHHHMHRRMWPWWY